MVDDAVTRSNYLWLQITILVLEIIGYMAHTPKRAWYNVLIIIAPCCLVEVDSVLVIDSSYTLIISWSLLPEGDRT